MQIKIKKRYYNHYPFMIKKGVIDNIWDVMQDNEKNYLITTSGDFSYELIPFDHADIMISAYCGKPIEESKPTKDSTGKLFYEIDWEFIEGMAKRMELNKQNGKYDRFGWRDKGVDVTEMNQALIRHLIAILKGELQDDEQAYSHYYALACNSMLIINTLKKQNNNNQLSMEFDKIDKHSL